MFNNQERVFSFGKKVELTPVEVLEKSSRLGGVESEILNSFREEWNRIAVQAEIGGGFMVDDRLLLQRLTEVTLGKLSEHGIVVNSADLKAFTEVD